MKYKPSQDQREVYETEQSKKQDGSPISSRVKSIKSQNNNEETASYQQYECNMVIWGKWKLFLFKHIYDEPIQLNIEVADQEGGLKSCIVDMISQQDYCLFVTEEGQLYAMGQSDMGMLGLG